MAIWGLFNAVPVYGQGCIVARSSQQPLGPESQSGYLAPGKFDMTAGYRHQFSFRHFVGSVEQTYRIQQGSQVMNKINLQDYNLTYQLTPRWSISGDVPLLLASRRRNDSPFTTTAQGFGDLIVSAQSWLFTPRKARRGNVSIGFGVMMPTGKDNIQNNVDRFDGKGPQNTIVDYSIQPGSGGWGIVFKWQSFVAVGKKSVLYFNGNYIATPQNTNRVLRTGANPTALTAYNSISDQYLLEAGIARPLKRVRGLSWSFGPRYEGVPARDLIGDSLGFRRPGFALSLEPGLQYSRGKNMASISVGKAVFRARTRSVPDIRSGGHGDAAFADYVWLASYSFRFGRPRNVEQ
jgi:hypothetical protein